MPWIIIAPIAAFVLALVIWVTSGYIKAPPDMAYLITGLNRKPRILIGKAGFKLPFLERVDKIYLGAIQIDVKTASSVPTIEFINIKIDSTVSIKVSQDPELLQLAAQNFLNAGKEEIAKRVNDLLEGNLREIAGTMNLAAMVNDRKAFSERVQENAVPDLKKLGLELISFNVQNFVDDNDVITNLGIDNVEQIRKAAAIAKSNAKREIAIAEAENAKAANDAKVLAAEEIAERNNDLAIKQAQLKKEADTQQAQADAAMQIEAENQRQLRDVAATNADIAKTERETELKRQQIELKERELDAIVRKKADADKYAAEKAAEADLIRRQREAEAKAYELQQASDAKKYAAAQEAEAQRAKADADKYAALAQAEGIRAVGDAEAEAIQKKAEAQKQMGEASVIEMVLRTLPQMTAAAAAPLEKVDSITIYGSDGGEKIVKDVTNISSQILNGLKDSGIDFMELVKQALNR